LEIRLLIACATEPAAALMARKLWLYGPGEPAMSCETIAIDHACRAAALLRPDVALLDRARGLHVLAAFMQASPPTRALLLDDGSARDDDLVEALRHGAMGCVQEGCEPSLIAKAVRIVFAGGTWWARGALLQALRSQLGIAPPGQIDVGPLTHREEEILRLTGLGLSNKEIARRLEISDHTVKTHLHRVYAKLHQSGRYKAFLAQPGPASADHAVLPFRSGSPHPLPPAADQS
jgi:two-component system nitrate/nitrite response regulator NarL